MTPEEARTLLGVTLSATPEEIKQAVRKLSIRYHPDCHVGASADLVLLAQREFSRVHEAGRLLSALLENPAPSEDLAAAEQADRALTLLDNGDALAAYVLTGEILARVPHHVTALTVRVRASWAAKEHNVALACSRRLVQINPTDWWSWFALGESGHEREHDAESIAAFQKALELAPPDVDVHTNILDELFHVQLFSRDLAGAESTLQDLSLISKDPNRLEVLRKLLCDATTQDGLAAGSHIPRWTDSPAFRPTKRFETTDVANRRAEAYLDPADYIHHDLAAQGALRTKVHMANALRAAALDSTNAEVADNLHERANALVLELQEQAAMKISQQDAALQRLERQVAEKGPSSTEARVLQAYWAERGEGGFLARLADSLRSPSTAARAQLLRQVAAREKLLRPWMSS